MPKVYLTGSPPRMRGKEIYKTPILLVGGITPAHAGKSCRPARRWSCPRDHPRTCGEKFPHSQILEKQPGSPPHMRRKVFRLTLAHCSKGITPAHAGKRGSRSHCACISRDHPRTCGEKVDEIVDTNEQVGSPPHMRGKEVQADGAPGDAGITPAHAGKSRCPALRNDYFWDHPRTCGEKQVSRFEKRLLLGSPPHMRGKACGFYHGV